MQVRITLDEQQAIVGITQPKGRTKWFFEGAGICWQALQKLREKGKADEIVVEKARAFLKTPEARKEVKEWKRQALVS